MLAFIEIESLRNRMIEKEKEVEDVRRSSLAPYRRWIKNKISYNKYI